jgi:hypothetical protein
MATGVGSPSDGGSSGGQGTRPTEREGRSGRVATGAAALEAEKGRGRRTARGGARRVAAGHERGARS